MAAATKQSKHASTKNLSVKKTPVKERSSGRADRKQSIRWMRRRPDWKVPNACSSNPEMGLCYFPAKYIERQR